MQGHIHFRGRAPSRLRRALFGVPILLTSLLVVPPPAAHAAPPTAPTPVAPPNGGQINGGPGQLFTVRATDPDGGFYTATITAAGTNTLGTSVTRTFRTSVGPSGSEVTGTPPQPLPAGSYTWSAVATDVDPTTSTIAVTPTTDVNPKVGSDSPPSAVWTVEVKSPANIGAGQVSGEVTYTNPGGLPGALSPCAETTFDIGTTVVEPTVDGVSNGIVLNIAGSQYAGSFKITGSGTGDCANALAGSGSLSVSITGTGPTNGNINCSLTGGYARVLSDVGVAVAGSCTINGLTTGNVNFRGQVAFRADPGQGLTSPVTHAVFAGYFTVTAA